MARGSQGGGSRGGDRGYGCGENRCRRVWARALGGWLGRVGFKGSGCRESQRVRSRALGGGLEGDGFKSGGCGESRRGRVRARTLRSGLGGVGFRTRMTRRGHNVRVCVGISTGCKVKIPAPEFEGIDEFEDRFMKPGEDEVVVGQLFPGELVVVEDIVRM